LHVLGTPPAFILSQDQTLRKKFHIGDVFGSYFLKLDMTGGAFYHSSVVKVLQTSGLDFTSITIACQGALETQPPMSALFSTSAVRP
jgi:hypothetical protein